MAKGKATGLWKGKVGMNVFYKITNSNNAQKQGIRERVIEVSNPKSYKQASQRYKMLPAQRIASALKEIVERGQQGVKYGAMSRNEFLSRALSMKTGFPFMEKSDPNIIPGEYQLTKGTLPEVVCVASENVAYPASFIQTNIDLRGMEIDMGSADYFGEIVPGILEKNPWLQEGDQMTFVVFYVRNGVVLSEYNSIILDPNDKTLNFSAKLHISDLSGNLDLSMETIPVVAGCVIISRANGANGYLRSNATLAVNKTDAAIAKYFNASGKDSAISSYEGNTSVSNNTNWPVDVDDNGGASGGGGEVTEEFMYTLQSADVKEARRADYVGKQILVGKGANTGLIKKIYYIVRDEQRVLCNQNGHPVTYEGGDMDSFNCIISELSDAFVSGKTQVDFEA